MKTAKSQTADDRQAAVGLVANGSSGSWDVALDETVAGPQRWFLQIDGPACYLYVQVKHPRTIQDLLQFLSGHLEPSAAPPAQPPPRKNELEISRSGGNVVTFHFDDENERRCFLLVAGKSDFRARIEIAHDDLQSLTTALRQVTDDLSAEGVLARAS